MTNVNLTSENSIKTPMGILYTEIREDEDYPGIYTYLLRENTSPILLSVVECETSPYKEENPRLNVLSYYRLDQDEPCHEGYIYQEDIDRYIEDRK